MWRPCYNAAIPLNVGRRLLVYKYPFYSGYALAYEFGIHRFVFHSLLQQYYMCTLFKSTAILGDSACVFCDSAHISQYVEHGIPGRFLCVANRWRILDNSALARKSSNSV